ncbi:MAG: SHOCT-like domain-containing protein [Candidatus Acidiferrales bacterium]
MNENRRTILEMLAAGKINAEEAERLIAALENDLSANPPGQGNETPVKVAPKYIHVVVNEEDPKGDNPTKANIRVPIQLLRAGVRLGSLIPEQAQFHVNAALREKGVMFDLSQIKPENLEKLIENLDDITLDIGQKNKNVKVRIFCE